MEDKYLYKALTKDEKPSWIIGNLVVELETNKHFIVDLSHFDDKTLLSKVMVEVDSHTICQSTGTRDDNNNIIYENDIIEILKNGNKSLGQGDVLKLNEKWFVTGNINEFLLDIDNTYYIKIIGNICNYTNVEK